MARKTKSDPKVIFDEELLQEIARVGQVMELRFRLREIKLADGQYHALTKPLNVRVLWDSAVGYFVAVDGKTSFAGAGDTAVNALREYLADWGEWFRSLAEDESILGPGLKDELERLRKLLGLTTTYAN